MAFLNAVPAEYGFVILTFIASIFLLQYLGIKVGLARKKHDVKYPDMYSKDDKVFNCIQRAHQNTLEGYPIFVVLLLLGGLAYPVVGAISGLVWIAGRIVYAHGYYTGDPAKRNQGAFAYFGLLTLLFCTGRLAFGLLGWA